MKYIHTQLLVMLASLLLSPTLLSQSRYNSNDYRSQLLRCESIDSNTKYCDADTRDGVRLARQLSKAPCIEGRSWGYDGRGIWVNDGCRAEFELGYDRQSGWQQGGGRDQIVLCESYGSKANYCNVDTRFGVVLVRQLSKKKCEEGRNWGANSQGIWVNYGCRGEFKVGSSYGYGQGRSQSIRCSSSGNRTNYCDVDTRGGVRLVRQLSSSRCIQGQTWGWDNRGVWVANNCSAEFEIGAGVGGPGYSNGGGYGNNDYGNPASGQVLQCASNDGRYNFCAVNSNNVREVRIERQLSKTPCRQNENWGFRNDGVWVNNGCRAEFRVY